MEMKSAVPFLAMMAVQFAQVALMVVSKKAMATGITNFTFIFYSNAIASLILLPSSFLIHRYLQLQPSPSLFFFFLGSGQLRLIPSVEIKPSPTHSFCPLWICLARHTWLFGTDIWVCRDSVCLCNTCLLNAQPHPRMEKVDFRSSSTLAKTIGTVVSVAGAFIVALYKGPTVIPNLSSSSVTHNLLIQHSNWIIGGIFLVIDCVFSSMFIIAQALVLQKCPAEVTVMFAYCFIVAILSAITSLIVEKDVRAWSLQPNIRLYAVLYSGVFGSAFQMTVGGWCVKRKGPLFVAMFHPLGIVIAAAMGFMFGGDAFYFGSLVGSIVIVIGFYSVMWGKAKERKIVEMNLESSTNLTSEEAPLLQNNVEVRTVQ